MIDSIIKCSAFVLDLVIKKKINKTESAERISIELKKISELLFSVANNLEQDIYPTGACATMQTLSSHLTQSLHGKIEEGLLIDLVRSLDSASEFERLYSERDPASIAEITKAAGRFEAASILILL